MYTGDGLEHSPAGIPSSLNRDHAEQSAKRLHKLLHFDYGRHWAEQRGSGPVCLLTWGSASGAVFEAAERLMARGRPTRALALRLLAPLRADALREVLADTEVLLVVEQNQSGQCFHYLHAHQVLPAHARFFGRAGPLALRPGEIIAAIEEVS
jgi:2-oxoglutarate ferredoxin oxidoreductase subunit alpha